jgi:hypothetical protein
VLKSQVDRGSRRDQQPEDAGDAHRKRLRTSDPALQAPASWVWANPSAPADAMAAQLSTAPAHLPYTSPLPHAYHRNDRAEWAAPAPPTYAAAPPNPSAPPPVAPAPDFDWFDDWVGPDDLPAQAGPDQLDPALAPAAPPASFPAPPTVSAATPAPAGHGPPAAPSEEPPRPDAAPSVVRRSAPVVGYDLGPRGLDGLDLFGFDAARSGPRPAAGGGGGGGFIEGNSQYGGWGGAQAAGPAQATPAAAAWWQAAWGRWDKGPAAWGRPGGAAAHPAGGGAPECGGAAPACEAWGAPAGPCAVSRAPACGRQEEAARSPAPASLRAADPFHGDWHAW